MKEGKSKDCSYTEIMARTKFKIIFDKMPGAPNFMMRMEVADINQADLDIFGTCEQSMGLNMFEKS